MLADIAPSLRTFFMPQVEQVGISEQPCRHGFQGVLDNDEGHGYLWAWNIGEGCLVTSHKLRMRRQRHLVEYPRAYACLCSTSAACVAGAPVTPPVHLREQENLLTFAQGDARVEFDIEANVPYDSTCICLTPEFFSQHPDLHASGFEDFAHLLSCVPVNMQPNSLRACMRCLDPKLADAPGAALYYRAKVEEAISLFVMGLQQGHRALCAQGERSQRDLVSAAQQLVRRNLDKHLSLDTLAADLFVSRSTLCATFKQETGVSLGEWVRAQRLERAQELIAGGASMAEAAHAVGYTRQGSFSEMFKRETGLTPTEWHAQL